MWLWGAGFGRKKIISNTAYCKSKLSETGVVVSPWTLVVLGLWEKNENECVFAEEFATIQCRHREFEEADFKWLSSILWKADGKKNQRTWVVMQKVIIMTGKRPNVKLDYYINKKQKKTWEHEL